MNMAKLSLAALFGFVSSVAFAQATPAAPENLVVVARPAAGAKAFQPPSLPFVKFAGEWERMAPDIGTQPIKAKTEFVVGNQGDGKVTGTITLYNARRAQNPVTWFGIVRTKPFGWTKLRSPLRPRRKAAPISTSP